MRIVLVASPWLPVPPRAYGGTERVVDTLARGLAEAGHDVLLWTTGDSTCPVRRRWVFPRATGVAAARADLELHQVKAAYEAAAAEGADLIHDHTLAGPVYAEHVAPAPIVVTAHGPFDDRLGGLYREFADRLALVAISHHQATTAVTAPIAAVIHHGVDPREFAIGAGDGGYALFLGRMVPEKGVDRAIGVARRAGVPLIVAAKLSEPHEYDYFEARVRPRLGRGVDFIGEVDAADTVDLLGRATCLLNPIAWPEPFGMVMIEALACGTPVVATPCGAAPEIVDEGITGFIRADEDGLAEALGLAASLDRRACRRALETRFSQRRMVADHVALYERVRRAPERYAAVTGIPVSPGAPGGTS